jgi:hypothetical protein
MPCPFSPFAVVGKDAVDAICWFEPEKKSPALIASESCILKITLTEI